MNKLMVNKEDAVLVLIDFQERLMPAMHNKEELEKTVEKLIKGCKILGVPAIVTQQYTKGLGPTIPSLHEALGDYNPIEKTSFSAMGEPEFEKELKELGRKSVILTGIESHVCVQQTALDLIDKGYDVFLVVDCVSSRSSNDMKYALKRMAGLGAIVTTYEAVLFELLKGAREEGFKQISALVK